MELLVTYQCDCKDPAMCVINKELDREWFKIKGLVDLYNAKVINKKIICNCCDKVIYKEKK